MVREARSPAKREARNPPPPFAYPVAMLANVATIMIRPRAVMRRILDAPKDRLWVPVLLLVALSAVLGDADRSEFDNLIRAAKTNGIPFAAVLAGIALVVTIVTFVFFYLFSFAAWGIGRVMEGSGTPRDLRLAVAWGLTPAVWALLYRAPAAFLLPRSDSTVQFGEHLRIDPGSIGPGCAAALVFGALELVIFIWCIVVSSNTIGEAHRFSSWRGLATVVLTSIAPLIIVLAAVLAM